MFLSGLFCVRLVFLSFCLYNRKTHTNTKQHLKTELEGKHKNNIKRKTRKHKSPSQTLRDIYLSRRFVGWKYCISVFFYVFDVSCSVVLCFFMFLFMFSPSLFKLLHLQSKGTYKNIKQKKHNTKKLRKTEQKQKSPSQTLRDIDFSRRFVGWQSGRGLDILYFCFVFVFL